MKYLVRAVIILGFLVGLLTLLMLVSVFFKGDDHAPTEAAAPRCDLLGEPPCRWRTESGDWSARLEPVAETSQGTEYRLEVRTPESPQRFLAVLRGESMYMGEYPVPLARADGEGYSARFTAPFCTVDATMTWRLDLQEGQAPIEGLPVTLVFEAPAH